MQDNFQDNDFQLLSQPSSRPSMQKPTESTSTGSKKKWLYIGAGAAVAVVLIAAIAVGVYLLAGRHDASPSTVGQPNYSMNVQSVQGEPTMFEPTTSTVEASRLREMLEPYDSTDGTGCAIVEITQNDIEMRVYYPRNATAKLCIGTQELANKDNILVLQAADIRADNGKIVGAFVEAGEPKAWGLSKKGYCGIINGQMTIGVADNSPLFEQATETKGYFFRQYALVDNGSIVESELKGKYIRRGLCDINGRIVVMETQSEESMHDFSQALVDLGVNNAIYLIGGGALGAATDLKGERTEWGRPFKDIPKYVNYLYWQKE